MIDRRTRQKTAAALAAVLGTSLFALSVPAAAQTDDAGASTKVTATAPEPLRHARQCASVKPSGATTVVVPVVVDLGGANDTAEVSCVTVPTGSTDAQVLVARAKMLGVAAPRYAESGLLCAIDGYPATGCGQETGSHYAYWAYFHGGSSWTYASVGPAEWTVSPGDVEGWRFEPEGSATPADPPPRAPSEAATLCPSSTPPTTTTTTVGSSPPTTSLPTTVPGGSVAPGGSGGTGSSAPTTNPGGPKPVVSRSGSERTPSTTGPSNATVTGSSAGASTSTSTSLPPSSGVRGAPGSTSKASGGAAVHHLATGNSQGHGDGLIGVIVAVTVIALLVAAAVIRTRRVTRVP